MSEGASLDTLAQQLGRARWDHERAPDDERKYTSMLEAEIAYLKADVREKERRRAGEEAKSTALRRSLAGAQKKLDRAERLLAEAGKPKRRKRGPTSAPPLMFELVSEARRDSAPAPEGKPT